MKYIFLLCSRNKNVPIEKRAYRALIFHTALWFIIGSVAAWGIGMICGAQKELISSYMITAGACSSLIIGYAFGVVWLFRYAK